MSKCPHCGVEIAPGVVACLRCRVRHPTPAIGPGLARPLSEVCFLSPAERAISDAVLALVFGDDADPLAAV